MLGKPIRLRFQQQTSLNAYLVKLERLTELDIATDQHLKYFKLVIEIVSNLDNIKGNRNVQQSEKIIFQLESKHPALVDMLERINNLHRNEPLDLHPGNVMMRQDTIVITDPYAG